MSNPAAFEPKEPVELAPPKDDPISVAELAKADGSGADQKAWVAIKRIVFDVTGNKSYLPGGSYHVFAGKDASRGLAKSSVKPEDAVPQWEDLPEPEIKVLNDWLDFFKKRYNIVGLVTN